MKMKVILLRDSRLGRRYEIKVVAPGLARNVLLPQGEALLATPANLAQAKIWREQQAKTAAVEAEWQTEITEKLTGLTVTVKTTAGPEGQLFAKLSSAEMAAALAREHGLQLSPTAIHFPKPIKSVGLHQATARLTGGREVPFAVLVMAELPTQ
jgi:large subunit ribosomal protein L9